MIKIMKYGEVSADEIFDRGVTSFDVADVVSEIIDNVRKNGDAALLEYTEKFDKEKLKKFTKTLSDYRTLPTSFVRDMILEYNGEETILSRNNILESQRQVLRIQMASEK